MDSRIPFLLLVSLFTFSLSIKTSSTKPISKITIMGVVYCDICSIHALSKPSYFLPGVKVHIDCKFKANSPTTSEQISFSANRSTDKSGVYKLEIPSVDGVKCGKGPAIQLVCEASLIGSSSSSSCNVPGLKMTSEQMMIKSKQTNHCIYCMNPMNYKPPKRDVTLCRNHSKETSSTSLDSSSNPPNTFPLSPLHQSSPIPQIPSISFLDPKSRPLSVPASSHHLLKRHPSYQFSLHLLFLLFICFWE